MIRIQGFSPISTPDAHVLILGSMPGIRSLYANEYYAHKGNVFWRMMGELIGAGWDKPYSERVRILNDKGIAVWDVIKSCVRQGSKDVDIRDIEPNDFRMFFKQHPKIRKIGFNGQKASDVFKKFARESSLSQIVLVDLPSTSSQNRWLSFPEKRDIYGELISR